VSVDTIWSSLHILPAGFAADEKAKLAQLSCASKFNDREGEYGKFLPGRVQLNVTK
jgi:hypothetical protein